MTFANPAGTAAAAGASISELAGKRGSGEAGRLEHTGMFPARQATDPRTRLPAYRLNRHQIDRILSSVRARV